MRKKELTKEEVLQRLEGLCARSEQCEFDLNRKMLLWGITSDQRKEVIEMLREHRYVDDARFARSYANDKARFSSWGPAKIRIELIKRRIKAPLIAEALKNVSPEVWKDGLLRCAVSKSKNLDLIGEDGYAERQKLFRYLLSRGFPSGASSKAVGQMKRIQEESIG